MHPTNRRTADLERLGDVGGPHPAPSALAPVRPLSRAADPVLYQFWLLLKIPLAVAPAAVVLMKLKLPLTEVQDISASPPMSQLGEN
jgi:hypothetical protein